jgi:hypothetical protein
MIFEGMKPLVFFCLLRDTSSVREKVINMQNFKQLICAVLFIVFIAQSTMAVDNPIKTALDGAMVRYNGRYYGMSGETNGQMLVSDNLVDWHSPVAVISDDVAGPYELLYRNGLFYLYSAGGYAVSEQPDVSFSDWKRAGLPNDEMRMGMLADGSLFSVNRRVGSKREGEITLQQYTSAWRTYRKPRMLLDGRKGLWDSLDSANLGEPEVLNYRGNYYLLYAANHPGPRTGMREIGVAMHESVAKIGNADKVADPVMTRNVDRLLRKYEPVLPSGEFGKWKARYTTLKPEGDWTAPIYKYSKWRTGDGGFGAPDELGRVNLVPCRTKWTDERIWIRREFDLLQGKPVTPVLNIRHEGAVQVFMNGRLVYESLESSPAYSNFDISDRCEGLFRPEDNVIAVRAAAVKNAKVQFIDFGLYDAGKHTVEGTVYGLDAPRIVTGPNGFEKWMTYEAWWNGVSGTGLDRIFFFDKELVVDGPTTTNTPGYHPPPAQPTLAETFTPDPEQAWNGPWVFGKGNWGVTNGVMRQMALKGPAKAFLRKDPASNYLFETDIRFPKGGKGEVGVVAWSNGKQDFMVSIHPAKKTWSYSISPGGLAPKRFKLPKSFKLQDSPAGYKPEGGMPLHRLKVTKNGGYFEVYLNDVNLLPKRPIITQLLGPGVPGLYCNNAVAEFDNITYTVGWDEYDAYITGWGPALDGTPFGGEWKMDKDEGLWQRKHSEIGRAFKGDLLDQYEFCVNARLRELRRDRSMMYGVFPVFTDKNNYLKAMIHPKSRELVVTGKLGGREIRSIHKSLRATVEHGFMYDKNTPHRDIISWVYEFRSQSVVSGFNVLWFEGDSEHLGKQYFVPSDDLDIRFAKVRYGRDFKPLDYLWEESIFKLADVPKPKVQESGIFNFVSMRDEDANYLGFGVYSAGGAYVIDKETGEFLRNYEEGDFVDTDREEVVRGGINESDDPARPLKTVINLELESSYFFRCVKLKDRVIIELNGRPMVEVPGSWPPSQVGLITDGQPTYYNGMSLHHLPD